MIEINPNIRFNISQVIALYENLFNTQIYTNYFIRYPKLKLKNNNNLIELNNFIISRITDIYIKNLNYASHLLYSCFFVGDIDVLSSWYLNYILCYYDNVNHSLNSLIPIFNSYFKKIFFEDKILRNCRRLLINLF